MANLLRVVVIRERITLNTGLQKKRKLVFSMPAILLVLDLA